MAIAKIKSENEDSIDGNLSSSDDSSKPTYLSSVSFVDLIETIFVKKEDRKPMDYIEQVTVNVKKELMDTGSAAEEIPFLSMKREAECEFLIKETSDGIETNSD